METMRIELAFIWIVVMLIYLLGDVLRIISGDVKFGEIEGKPITQPMMLGIAVLMLIPILMIYVSITVEQDVARWANILSAGGFLLLNGVSINTYPGWYDRFLLAVSMVFNGITIWQAWNWV